MGWGEVKKINSDTRLPLNELIVFGPLNDKSFGGCTDDGFITLVNQARAGSINLQSIWHVGDTRDITMSDGESVTIVLTAFTNYEGCGSKFTFDFLDCLATTAAMNSSNTNVGGYGSCLMYTTTLPQIYVKLPKYLKSVMLTFNVKVSAGNQSSTIQTISNNRLALRSEQEIFGAKSYSSGNEGSHVAYYNSTARRIKKVNGSAGNWWLRSPDVNTTNNFCSVTSGGTATNGNANTSRGVAPFGCI